jgi:hypothetical protein
VFGTNGLSHGFSWLREVSISVILQFLVQSLQPEDAKVCKESKGVSPKQFPRLWENTDAKLNFFFKRGVKV